MSAFNVLESDSLDTDNTSNTAPSQPHLIKTIGTPSGETKTTDEGVVRVPEDCNTLKEAVDRVHGDDRLTTIVVGKGEHQIDGNYLEVPFAMNIVGDPGVPKSEIVVVGGIKFKKGIPGNCHLEHLTLRQAKKSGVYGLSSFTMDDVLVEQCGFHGVWAKGTGVVGRCTNVEVRQCKYSGVRAHDGASITLIGAKTTVHHNCTVRYSNAYGLTVYDSSSYDFSSTIQLVSPLTKEQVSLDNGGGGNWGAEDGGDINQIKTIFPATKMNDVNTNAVKLDAARLDAAYKRAAADGGVAKWHRSRLMIVGEGN